MPEPIQPRPPTFSPNPDGTVRSLDDLRNVIQPLPRVDNAALLDAINRLERSLQAQGRTQQALLDANRQSEAARDILNGREPLVTEDCIERSPLLSDCRHAMARILDLEQRLHEIMQGMRVHALQTLLPVTENMRDFVFQGEDPGGPPQDQDELPDAHPGDEEER